MSISELFLGQKITIDIAGNFLGGASVLKSNLTNAEIVEPTQLITKGFADEMKTNMDADMLVERQRLDALLLGADISVDTLLELKQLSDSIKTEGDAAHVNLASVIAALDATHVADMTAERVVRDAEKTAYELKATQDDARFVTEQTARTQEQTDRDNEIAAAKVVADAKTQLDDDRFNAEQARVNVVAVADNVRYDDEVIRMNIALGDQTAALNTATTQLITQMVTADESQKLEYKALVVTEQVRASLAEQTLTTQVATEKVFTTDRYDTEKIYTQNEVDALKGRCVLLEQQLTDLYDFFLDHDRFTKPIRSE
jgi:hypothetical protein